MSSQSQSKSMFFGTLEFMELVFHSVVREVRTQSGNATLGILREVVSISVFLGIFYLLFLFMGRQIAIRGDFMMFLLTGIVLMVIHIKAISSVRGASNATAAIMQHAPMTVILSIITKAFAGLYLQGIAISMIVLFLWIFGMDLAVKNPAGLVLPVIFSWASGISIGLIFMMASPVAPMTVKALTPFYMRAQMITSGKFMPAAYMPTAMLPWFQWNPLFHTIDQARLATFVNYNKEVSSMAYPIWFTLIAMTLGLMGEFWSRKNLSKSKHGIPG